MNINRLTKRLLTGLALILFTSLAFAKQGTYALVPPYLDYSKLGSQHPAASLARFSYSAFRSGLAEHSLILLEQNYNLSFKEASPPSASQQANLARFYSLTAKEKDQWIKKQKVEAIIWLEFPFDLDKQLNRCKPNNCSLPFTVNIHFPKSLIYSYSSSAELDADSLTLTALGQASIINASKELLNNLWNSCADKKDKKTFPKTICGKKAKQISGVSPLSVEVLDPSFFDPKPEVIPEPEVEEIPEPLEEEVSEPLEPLAVEEVAEPVAEETLESELEEALELEEIQDVEPSLEAEGN